MIYESPNPCIGSHGSDEVPRAVGGNRMWGPVPLEPGVGVEPTSAIRSWMLTTGCYEMFLQPVA